MLKIAFLFLTIGNVYHQDYWELFFKGHQEYYSVYVHSKEALPQESFFKKNEIPAKIPTTWANSVEAQVALLKEALKDPENEKFIFVSESTLPLQAFDKVYATVMARPESIFSYHKSPHSSINNGCYGYRSLRLIPEEFHYKNSQWVILNRKHAELIANDTTYLPKIVQYEADNELYFGTFLASQHLLHEVFPVDMTYVDWQKHNKEGRKTPHEFRDLSDEYDANQIVNVINNNVLFMRKFSKNIDLSRLEPYLPYCFMRSNVEPLKIALYNRCVEARYRLIQSVADTYKTPITVFDCGARQGYYAYKMVQDYAAVCLLWEQPDRCVEEITRSRLVDLHTHKYNNHHVLLFNKAINAGEIEELSICTAFDIVLAFNVIELFGREWHTMVQALLRIGSKIIVEIPANDSLESMDLRHYVEKRSAVLLGNLQENKKVISSLYLLQNNNREFPVKM